MSVLLELSKYLERKEELESIKMKKQHKEYVQSFGCTSKTHINNSTDRKKRLELSSNGNNKTNLFILMSYIL